MQAARLQQMGISCLIVEKEPRIGNSWRKRYPSLRLHVPKAHSPSMFTDTLGDFIQYSMNPAPLYSAISIIPFDMAYLYSEG